MWNRVDVTTPPEGEVVRVLTETGSETELAFYRGLWYLPDMSMYVYYAPMFWKRMGS